MPRLFPSRVYHTALIVLLCALPGASFVGAETRETMLDYNKNVRAILGEHCFKCHGHDEKRRKAKLHLDERDGAGITFGETGGLGNHAVRDPVHLNEMHANMLNRRNRSRTFHLPLLGAGFQAHGFGGQSGEEHSRVSHRTCRDAGCR